MNATRPKILCVDDEPANLKLLAAVLLPWGYEVIQASDGAEALLKIKDHSVDLVLLDVMMPNLNGFDVCRILKEDERYRDIPVVMITALQSKQDRIQSIEAGAEDFISKPFDHAEVLARIKMLLRIKSLNDRLNQAYDKIVTITSIGRQLLNRFDPLNFDFMRDIDHLVSQLIRQADKLPGKPEFIMARIASEERQQWYMFQASQEGLSKKAVEFDISECIPLEQFSSKITFSNEADLESSDLRPLVDRLKSLEKPVSNAVSYLTNAFCIAAFNYGRQVSKYDAAVLESLVAQSLSLKSIASQVRETENAFDYVVHALARAAEVNDEDTGNHILRVGEYCGLISKDLGMSEKYTGIIKLQALMHDVGKIHIPPEILKKPGKLTQAEFELVKKHPEFGGKILGEHVRLTLAKTIAMTHHERWDGGGYPQGLKGEQIPMEGRIANLADIYDALRNKRVYKPAFDHETTYRIITEGDGRTMPGHFDPQILKAFKDNHKHFEKIYETYKD